MKTFQIKLMGLLVTLVPSTYSIFPRQFLILYMRVWGYEKRANALGMPMPFHVMARPLLQGPFEPHLPSEFWSVELYAKHNEAWQVEDLIQNHFIRTCCWGCRDCQEHLLVYAWESSYANGPRVVRGPQVPKGLRMCVARIHICKLPLDYSLFCHNRVVVIRHMIWTPNNWIKLYEIVGISSRFIVESVPDCESGNNNCGRQQRRVRERQ